MKLKTCRSHFTTTQLTWSLIISDRLTETDITLTRLSQAKAGEAECVKTTIKNAIGDHFKLILTWAVGVAFKTPYISSWTVYSLTLKKEMI